MANVSVVCVGRSVIKLWGFFMFICFRFFISYLISARQFFRNFLFYVNTWGKVKKEPSAVINLRKLFCLYFFFLLCNWWSKNLKIRRVFSLMSLHPENTSWKQASSGDERASSGLCCLITFELDSPYLIIVYWNNFTVWS